MSDRAFLGPADTYLENRQIVFAEDYEQLERELAEAKDEVNTWKAVAEARLENFHHYHDQSIAYHGQLTAHKAVLTKSYNTLEEIVSSPFYQRSCKGGEMERLINQAIKHLTSVNHNQASQ